jgi:proline iminopeptidase
MINTPYPSIDPYKIHQLKVDLIHTLYIEECGNPQGLPIVYLHGGPGFGCDADNRRYFDPDIYRIILFDQRGAGRSTPFAEIQCNTTHDLVKDMERIREYLNIDQWILFGGSWGSTLALVYAQAHPQRVLACILRGIFLARPEDIHWFFGGGGAKDIFPDQWQGFVKILSKNEKDHLLKAYYARLTSSNKWLQMQAAHAWVKWQAYCATLCPDPNLLQYVKNPQVAISAAKLECHYYLNNCFLSPYQILDAMPMIQGKPCIIIHGRYDMIFNMKNAWDLHLAWPGSQISIIDNGGHAAIEPTLTQALISATQTMAKKFYE